MGHPDREIVYDAAAQFLAAYIVSGKVTNENEAAMMEKSVVQAVDLVKITDKMMPRDDD